MSFRIPEYARALQRAIAYDDELENQSYAWCYRMMEEYSDSVYVLDFYRLFELMRHRVPRSKASG